MPDSSRQHPQGTVMAFDFGTRSIGMAVGQTITATASPLAPISAKDGIPDWQHLEQLLREWKPAVLVIGLPLNMDGSESEFCQRARKFARRLQGRFGFPCELWDERLTTREAKELAGHHGDYRNKPVDSIAATLLLESWLNSNSL
jgi:putative Holliday junction resolvase